MHEPPLGVSVRSVHLVAGRLEFYSGRVVLKTLKVVSAASRQALGASGSAKG